MDGQQFPHFLVIGGMKCGSTTLYDDLAAQSGVAIAEKELNVLSDLRGGAFSYETAREVYAGSFSQAKPNVICGDVSTTYAKLPEYPNVAEHAWQTIGDGLKIVYIVREPISRCISHHHHMHAWRGTGHMSADIDACVREHSSLIDFSRYAMQLAPWRERFGADAVHIIVFEEFVRDRRSSMQTLAQFLGFRPDLDSIENNSISNRSESKPVLNKFWMQVHEHTAYRGIVRRLLPGGVRQRFRQRLLPKAPPRPAPPSIETVAWIQQQTHKDELTLREWMGRDKPLWDFAAVKSKYDRTTTVAARSESETPVASAAS